MSKTTISLIVVVVLAAILGGLWWIGALNDLSSKLNLDLLLHEEEVEDTSEPEPTGPESELATGGDTSDDALENDLNTLNIQLDAYSETSSELDASLNDEPVEQDSNF